MAETPRGKVQIDAVRVDTVTVVASQGDTAPLGAAPTGPAQAGSSFEQSLGELEQIVRQLEEGQLGLAESLASYESGVKRLKECYQLLERAERRIELLERVDADGEGVTRPFDAAATIDRHALATDGQPLPPKPGPRRAAKPAPRPTDVDGRRDVGGRDVGGRDSDERNLDGRAADGPRDLF